MTPRTVLAALAVAVVLAVATLPIWGMGVAVFLDAERTILSRHPSPDGSRIAQVERLVVGGVPSLVVVVRSSWMPNWYLTGCVAASHYQDTAARPVWKSNDTLVVRSADDARYWKKDAPFKGSACTNIKVRVVANSPVA